MDTVKQFWDGPTKQIQNIDVADAEGKSGFLHAVINKKRDIINYLVEQQCDINIRDKEGKTALHYAASNADKNQVLFLLLNKAEPGVADNDGKLPGHDNIQIKAFISDVEFH